MEENKIETLSIKIDDKTTLYVEKNLDNDFAEFMVFIKKNDGFIQDLARIGQEISYNESLGDLEKIPCEYYVKVYADEMQEDYTDEFTIKEYKEPDVSEWRDHEDGSGALYVNGEKRASYDLSTKEICLNGEWQSINDWLTISVDKVHEYIKSHV